MVQISNLSQHEEQQVTLKGWVATRRTGGKIAFITLRDGSGYVECVINLQDVSEEEFEAAKRITQESSIILTGTVIKNDRQSGGYELQVKEIEVVHIAEEFPLGKKAHGPDFLLNHRHLWLRSKKQWAILRIRNQLKMSIHNFFQERGFIQTDSPILTGNAAEGTSDLFGTEFYKEGVEAYLSQSGQLYAEATAMAMGKVYTFGPCFRAEKSVTPRHLSEFWMIEPEMAFYDLDMDMDLIEEFIRFIITDVFEKCQTELKALDRDTFLFEHIHKPFPRITYEEAVDIIRGEREVNGKNAITVQKEDLVAVEAKLAATKTEIDETEVLLKGNMKKGKRNYLQSKVDKLKKELKQLEEDARNIPLWIESSENFVRGEDFGAPNERVLTRLYDTPVMVYKWPRAIKAFYMKRYPDDPEYIKGVDVLAPEGFGEVVGGSEREDDLEVLLASIRAHNLPEEVFQWYTDLRRYGSVPHSGFGLGFERTVMWITGAKHIRQTIPFPRYYGRLFP